MLRLHQHIDFPGLEKKFLQLKVNDDKEGKIKEGKGGMKYNKVKKERRREREKHGRKEGGRDPIPSFSAFQMKPKGKLRRKCWKSMQRW